MDLTKLIAVVTILCTLSVATERLVEIMKGFFPKLGEEGLQGDDEVRRKAKISALAVGCGIVTAFLASPILSGLFTDIFAPGDPCRLAYGFLVLGSTSPCSSDLSAYGVLLTVAFGFLASGGSSFWNSILEYLLQIKKLKKIEVRKNSELAKIEIQTAEIRRDALERRLGV